MSQLKLVEIEQIPVKHDGQLTISVGKSRFDTAWKNRPMLWSQLLGRLGQSLQTAETHSDYLRMKKDRQDQIKDIGGFVGGELKGGHRKSENVISRCLLTLDLDFAPASFPDDMTNNLDLTFAYCIYSTHKYAGTMPKFRLVIPLSRSVSSDEYEAIARKIAEKIGIDYGIVSIVLTFTIVELFDNMGTLIGLSRKAGLMRDDGHIENIDRALLTDSVGTMASSLFGTSTVTSYVESAAGIAQGGRTGLTAVTVAVLFAVSLIFSPLVSLVPPCATAPALIIVGALMISDVARINFNDFTDAVPAFLTIIMMPLTYSIASGFGFGFVSYAFIKLFTGRGKEVSPFMWCITLLFLANFAMRG